MFSAFRTTLLLVTERLSQDATGAAMVEYGLLVALIALLVAAGATAIGQDISTFFAAAAGYLVGLAP